MICDIYRGRDLCDFLMKEHISEERESIDNAIVEFRKGLSLEQKVKFNQILDRINVEDSEYAYKAFDTGRQCPIKIS